MCLHPFHNQHPLESQPFTKAMPHPLAFAQTQAHYKPQPQNQAQAQSKPQNQALTNAKDNGATPALVLLNQTPAQTQAQAPAQARPQTQAQAQGLSQTTTQKLSQSAANVQLEKGNEGEIKLDADTQRPGGTYGKGLGHFGRLEQFGRLGCLGRWGRLGCWAVVLSLLSAGPLVWAAEATPSVYPKIPKVSYENAPVWVAPPVYELTANANSLYTELNAVKLGEGALAGTPQLDAEDMAILKELARKDSRKTGITSKPVITRPGEVSFIFGASNPTLVCSLLHVCDIALEPGESVMDLKIGDSTRWIIERSASGSPEGIVEHVIVKPTDIGLQSNLRIYTDRRSYYLDLKSAEKEFMPSVKFLYPESALQKFAQIKAQLQYKEAERQRNTLNVGQQGFSLTDLNFNYDVDGDESILPLRVFNDQRKTYIQMSPKLMTQGRLPAVVAVNSTGGWFDDDKTALINYRIIDNNFVIDGLPPHIRLVLGQNSEHALSVDIKLQS